MARSSIRISDQWHGMKSVPATHRKELQLFIDSLDFPWLQRRASIFLGENCEARTDLFAVGREHVVYEIISPSAAAIVRIQKPLLWQASGSECQSMPSAQDMCNEAATLRYVSNNTTIPVPHLYEYDPDRFNPFGAAYMLMEEMQSSHPSPSNS